MENKKFYLSTAIAYTSSIPHIGNVYETILSDCISRFKRLQGYDVYFQTGTDEHGPKIEEKAKAASLEPQAFVDGIANEIKRIYKLMNISYDKFIRTTDKDHEKVVQQIFTKLYEQGDIYKGHYEGLYCKYCESFYTEKELVDGNCPDCNREVKKTKEEAYFLKLSKYQERLVQHIKDNPDFKNYVVLDIPQTNISKYIPASQFKKLNPRAGLTMKDTAEILAKHNIELQLDKPQKGVQ